MATTVKSSDAVLRESPEEVVARADMVGRDRLERSRADVLVTAAIGGVEVSLGALAATAVLGAVITAAPGVGLSFGLAVGGLVFPIGFLFVILGRSELFTENFLIPVVTVVRDRERWPRLAELWALSWAGNLFGCAVIAALISVADATGTTVHTGFAAYTAHKLSMSPLGTFVSAILAGITMTILTWLVVAVQNMAARIAAILAAGYLLYAANLAHTIVGSAVIFAGWHEAGRSPAEVAEWLALATTGNLVGGIALVTALRVAQAKAKVASRKGD
ncbi:MAG: formate/nitrite transporter family protein [Candidatus Dormibacteraeota bacterium]|nr:formate/nitrite transporter family protein [Candidatus Dormibacteraeota bacterium]